MISTYILLMGVWNSSAQGIRDSLFKIKSVEIHSQQIFKKEEAGMKQSKPDSTILLNKISLSLSELLSENTPIFVKSMGRGALATASFRGTAASHTQVNWNGININDPMTGMVDFSLIPVYIIDDMNLNHGAASIQDQSGGLGGSVNFSNKPNWDNRFSGKYIQGVGSYDTFDEFLKLAVGSKKVQFKTRWYHSVSDNDYKFLNRRIVRINNEEDYKLTSKKDTNKNANWIKYGCLQEVYYRISQKHHLSAKYWGQYADRTIPRVISFEGNEGANLNNQYDTDHKAVVDWTTYQDKYKLVVRSGYSSKNLDYYLYNHITGKSMEAAIYSESEQQKWIENISLKYNINESLNLLAKVNIDYTSVFSKDSVKRTGYDKDQIKQSYFLSIHKNIKRLNLNLMFRQETIDDKIAPFIPFLGFDYRVVEDKDWALKGNISRSYHHPTLNDLYWQPGGKPDLKAERGYSTELGIENLFVNQLGKFKSELTFYYMNIDDWIIWKPDFTGAWVPQNLRNVISKGIEFNLNWEKSISKWNFKSVINYNLSSSKNYPDTLIDGDQSYGKQLPFVPLHGANIMLNASFKNYELTYQWNYYSRRYTTTSNKENPRDDLYPYFMNDLSLGTRYQLKKYVLGIKLKVHNLFDEAYHSVLIRPMPRRNYMLQISLKF